jgi:hypothetical protein
MFRAPLAVAASKPGTYQMLCIQFLSSWWWTEEPPETCRAVTIIKNIVKRCILLVVLKRIVFRLVAAKHLLQRWIQMLIARWGMPSHNNNECVGSLGKKITCHIYIATGWTVRGSNPGGCDFRTDPETHPASYTMGTGSFPWVKWPERGVDHPSHLASKLKKD